MKLRDVILNAHNMTEIQFGFSERERFFNWWCYGLYDWTLDDKRATARELKRRAVKGQFTKLISMEVEYLEWSQKGYIFVTLKNPDNVNYTDLID